MFTSQGYGWIKYTSFVSKIAAVSNILLTKTWKNFLPHGDQPEYVGLKKVIFNINKISLYLLDFPSKNSIL